MNRQKFGGSEPLDLEAIRQSPRQFVDLDTVEKLSDYAMVCELKIERLTAELAEIKEAKAIDPMNETYLAGYNAAITAQNVASTINAPKAQSEPVEDIADWLITEISAIDCRYRGDPSYDHDAYWMRERVIKLIESSRAILNTTPQPAQEDLK